MNLHRSLSFATTSWCVRVCTRLPTSVCDDVILFRDDAINIGAFYMFYTQENSQSVPLVAATLQVSHQLSCSLSSILLLVVLLLYLLPTPIPTHSRSPAHLSLLVHSTLPPPHFPPPSALYISLCICVLGLLHTYMHMFEVMFLRVFCRLCFASLIGFLLGIFLKLK